MKALSTISSPQLTSIHIVPNAFDQLYPLSAVW
jgi:hypothetical protein